MRYTLESPRYPEAIDTPWKTIFGGSISDMTFPAMEAQDLSRIEG